MQLFIAVLTESEYVSTILKKFADNNYHGSVLETKSIRHALMDSVEPLPYFGGLSKVVDEEGRPVVMYHGTMSKFDTFDINKAKEGVFGKGFYFAFDETLPIKIGRIVMPVYLKVENPINAEEKVATTWGGYKPKRSIVEIRKEVKKSKYDGVIAAGEIMVKNIKIQKY